MSESTQVEALTSSQFVDRYLTWRQPVVVRGAAAAWNWAPEWDFATLTRRFGEHRVPLYDSLFSLYGVSTFGEYVARHIGVTSPAAPPYLRWYARQNASRLPWADTAFTALADDWSMPSWLPDSGYVFPRLRGPADAARDPFPAKGIFVCGAQGRTRLHVDPWASDACLCQTTGRKRVMLFRPDSLSLLSRDGKRNDLVDLDQPDASAFPHWRNAAVELDVVLEPGDCIYIPAGWPHAAIALTDSVSLTWNFVHEVHDADFSRYLSSGGADDVTVRYFTAADLR
ncbi:hypothetical protein JOD64_005409 [Micromonospora luteifusca]|uniref:JmjC domain-containing protein n=1 Tax=Micromonospora luteifusca TaxID=709860 RepID=A0ABS2M1A3_9ACTN|nr:cupin-like domain-containing protein [Micromonospora luteifusca]MBM7494187.1 hypothetical protein [Micromonospora luteifusca]